MSKMIEKLALASAMEAAANQAAPFRTLATEILSIAQARAAASTATTAASEGLWGKFREALDLGASANLSPSSFRLGLAVACTEAGVPDGTIRSYTPTIGNMYEEVQTGVSATEGPALTREQALLLKVKDARERYQDAAKKADREARARLAEAIKGWSVTDLDDLTAYAEAVNAERKAKAEADKAEQAQVANG